MIIDFQTQLKKDINKLIGTLKPNEELKEVLKRRLTKKEYKYYVAKIDNIQDEQIKEKLKLDDKRLEHITKQTILKLNQEKIKKELII